MTDITRLLASLRRRSAHAKEFGDSITFVKLKDIDALVEALEKAQQRIVELQQGCENDPRIHEIIDLKERIAELEESHAQVIQSRDHYKRMSEEGLKQLAESRTVTVKLPKTMYTEFDGDDFCREVAVLDKQMVIDSLTAAGIKWEAE